MPTQSKPTPTKKYERQIKKLEKEKYTIEAGRALFGAYDSKGKARFTKKQKKERSKRLKEIPKEINKLKKITKGKDKRVTKTKIGKTTTMVKPSIKNKLVHKLMKRKAR